MGHIGIISPPVWGHLHPFGALGRALIKRGHRVTLFHQADIGPKAKTEGLEFCTIGQQDHPAGSLETTLSRISQLKGLAALRFTIEAIKATTQMICRDGPQAIREAKIDLLLVDQTEGEGGLVAEHLKIPFITVCNALAINRESSIPPVFTEWGYSSSIFGKLRNTLGYHAWDWMMKPIMTVLQRYSQEWTLPLRNKVDDYFSPLAQISQLPAAFDFPRQMIPKHFHYLGPFRETHTQKIGFPWAKLDGRPLIYVSLGTLQNRTPLLLRSIAEACKDFPLQMVISHGGVLAVTATLPGNPLVVSYAPQQELMTKAKLTVSHCGLNTVLDSLSQGVPVVGIPLTYEQPAIAARLQWSGAGRIVPFAQFSAERLKQTVKKVLDSESIYTAARRVGASIQKAGGAERAVDIIEQVLRTGKPVPRVEGAVHV